ncbi:MAG: rod shape-determining protein MreC [Bacilli bacterium]|nr:rod shape-determining protein MreC [Bacilli bacterium]
MRNRKYYPIIVLVIVSAMLLLFSVIINDKRNLTIIEKIFKDTTLSINTLAMKPINILEDKIKEYNSKQKLYEKYEKLSEKYSKVELMETKYEEAKKEINDLKKVLNLNNTLSENSYMNATVITRNIGYWYNNITIDKGEKDGIKKDMAVITNDGLVGTVIKTSNLNSTVKLLTTSDTNNKISVKIKIGENEYLYGLLTGYNKEKKCFIVEGISENTDIKKGSIITTTGLGNGLPSGILIGRVESISKDNFDLARTVLVKSSVNFDDISYVTVLKKEEKK